jgi:hypothetical protein
LNALLGDRANRCPLAFRLILQVAPAAMMAYGDRDLTRCPARDRRFCYVSSLETFADMTKSEFRVAVRGEDIVVTLPGSIYSVTYYKPEGSAHLLARDIADQDDLRFRMTVGEFLGTAWRLANDKARELGWIV